MNNTASRAIASEIETLRDNLRTATAAIPIVGKAALAKAKELEADIAAANDRFATMLADEAETERKARLAAFTDISVAVDYPGGTMASERNLLRAIFVIEYTKVGADYRTHELVPQHFRFNGFAALPDDAYQYLVHCHPEAIPDCIMELCPGDPHEAFRAYFMGKQRGMFRTENRI